MVKRPRMLRWRRKRMNHDALNKDYNAEYDNGYHTGYDDGHHDMLRELQLLLSGRSWNAATRETIVEILTQEGLTVIPPETHDQAEQGKDGD